MVQPTAAEQDAAKPTMAPRPRLSAREVSADFFVERLADLYRRRCLATNTTQRRLLDFAIYSTYLDCLALKQGQAARACLRRPRDGG